MGMRDTESIGDTVFCLYVFSVAKNIFVFIKGDQSRRCPCMAINVNVQYNGGLLPDIILLTQCYLHWGTCSNAMKRFCICSHLNVSTFFPP